MYSQFMMHGQKNIKSLLMFATNISVLSSKGWSFTLHHSPIISCLCDKTRHYAAQNNIYTAPLHPHPSTQHSL